MGLGKEKKRKLFSHPTNEEYLPCSLSLLTKCVSNSEILINSIEWKTLIWAINLSSASCFGNQDPGVRSNSLRESHLAAQGTHLRVKSRLIPEVFCQCSIYCYWICTVVTWKNGPICRKCALRCLGGKGQDVAHFQMVQKKKLLILYVYVGGGREREWGRREITKRLKCSEV